jgi:Concanavalin A-like lectin/glucanases superfamily
MKTNKILVSALAFGIAFTTLVSCGDDEETTPTLPPIGGYNSADEVGSADLLAYWPLNGSGVEAKSNTAPTTTVGTTWETGAKGQGAKLTAGFMKYPTIASFPTTLTAYTMSAWVKVKNNQTPTSGSASVFLSLARPNEWEGNINLYAETGQKPAIETNGAVNDSILIKNTFRSTTSDGQSYENLFHLFPWMKADNILTPGKHVANPVATGGVWAHYLATWDGANNKFIIYINGKKSSNPAFEVRGSNTSVVFDTPSFATIGAFGTMASNNSQGSWDIGMTGNIDEIRVWKKALNAADINALYELEKAGR